MIISVPTIMHTGTHLLKYGLFKDFEDRYPRTTYTGEDIIMTSHVDTPHLDLFMDVHKKYPVVTCLRHPSRVFESFSRREKKVKLFGKFSHMERTREQCIEQWENMINAIEPLNPYYIHIDSHDVRDREVELISELTGKPLSVDWKRIYNKNDSKQTHDIAIGKAPQEFIDFYEDTKYAGT